MGTLHREIWVSTGGGASRRQRASGVYYWFLPTKLCEQEIVLEQDVVADVARAERCLAQYDRSHSANIEGIARLLLRSESVASSRIEGLVIGSNRLLRAELQVREPDNVRYDSKAASVLGNIRAMERAVALATSSPVLSVATLQEVHRELCEGTDLQAWGGRIRTTQNWVGGGSSNPLTAEYVPPAPHEVPAMLEDLVAYANRTDISPVVQAARCHAQFESIHPFVDGNGRTGRALIQICLLRRKAVVGVVPPISLALATERGDYYDALYAMQHATDERAEHEAANDWISYFAGAVVAACADAEQIEADLEAIRAGWVRQLGRVRAGSALEQLLDRMQVTPIFSAETMVRETGRSKQAVGQAIQRLLEAGIIRQTNKGKRSRIFEVPEALTAFNMIERRLASPERNTRMQPPARPVPERYV